MGFHSVSPKIRIEISGNHDSTVLNKIKYAGLCAEEIERKEEKLVLNIKKEDYGKVEKIIKNCGCQCQVVREIGIYFRLKRIRNLYSYVTGVLICAIILYMVSLFLWNIEFEGNHTITDEQLQAYLQKHKIHTGMFLSGVDCNGLEAGIRNEYFDVTWVCAEIKGTNLIIHIKENYNKEISVEEKDPYDLVAKHHSVVDSIITRSGVPQVKKGDIVKKGDVLISGAVELFDDFGEKISTEFVHADGDVFGKTTFSYQDSFDLKHTERIVEEKSKNNGYVEMFGITFEKKLKDDKPYYVIDEYENLKLFGNFYIPVRIGMKKQFFYENTTRSYTKQEATEIAEGNLRLFLKSLEEKEMQILEKDVKIDVGKKKCTAKGTVTVIESLAKVAPIHYQEEGTTEADERN